MIKIKGFPIEKLYNEEDFGFEKLIEAETGLLTLETDQEMVRVYKEALLAYDLALKSSTINSHTTDIVSIDALTDAAWRGLHSQTKTVLKHPNVAFRDFGAQANTIINKYGDITRMGYNEKYGCDFNLLQDFNVWGVEKQQVIGVYDWLIELQTRYDEYMVAKLARAKEDSHHITGIIKDMRNKANGAYRALVERVNALTLINGVEAYLDFITNVNVFIDDANAVLAARKTRAKKNEKPSEGGAVEV